MDFAVQSKNKRMQMRDKYLDLAREKKKKQTKTMEHEDDSDTNCNWCTWNNTQRSNKGTGRL